MSFFKGPRLIGSLPFFFPFSAFALPQLLTVLSLWTLIGCSRAQKSDASDANAAHSAPPSSTATASATNANAQIAASTLIASAPHPDPATSSISSNTLAAQPPQTPSTGVVLHLLVPNGHGPAWLGDAVQSATGTRVEIKTYNSDEELAADLQVPGSTYDLLGASDRAAAGLIEAHQLRPLPGEITPLASLPAPEFLHHYFDPVNQFTWPYAWTLWGFAVQPTPQGGAPFRTWRDLGRDTLTLSLPENRPFRDGLWALAMGRLPGFPDPLPPSWQKAAFDFHPPVAGDPNKVWVDTISHLHPLLSRPGEKWEVVLPAEGSLISLYQWAIPANTAQPQAAEAALRALAAPGITARLTVENDLAVTQPQARLSVPPALLNDPLVYPSDRLLNQCRFVRAK